MALVTPPYVLASASHSAELFRDTLQGYLSIGGVIGVGDLAVAALTPASMKVKVAVGQCMIPGTLGATGPFPSGLTQQGAYYSYVSAVTNLTIAASTPTNPRIDSIVASIQDSQYSGSNNQAILQVITGTPAVTPSPPATPASSLLLAHVRVPAGATSIITADITTTRPFVALANPMRAVPAGIGWATSTTSVTNGVGKTINLGGYSLKGGFTSGTNRLIVPVAGTYLVAGMAATGWHTGNNFAAGVTKNGSPALGTGVYSQIMVGLLTCAAGDYLQLTGFNATGTTRTVVATSKGTLLSAALVSQ